jgi:TonB family protein
MSKRLVVSLIVAAFLFPTMAAEPAKPALPDQVLRPSAEEWCPEGTASTPDTDCVSLPVLISAAPPSYPELALKGRISGQVELEVIVDAKGKVVDARVLRPNRVFNDAALAAARQRTYKPSLRGGVAVATAFPVVVRFEFALPTDPRQSLKTGAGEIVTVTPYDTKGATGPSDQGTTVRDTQGSKK